MVNSLSKINSSTVQLWRAKSYDDKICSMQTLESALLEGDREISSQSTLLLGGHVSGHISLLKGKGEYCKTSIKILYPFSLQPIVLSTFSQISNPSVTGWKKATRAGLKLDFLSCMLPGGGGRNWHRRVLPIQLFLR